jgi:mono/diheme cytochrome c family protein
MCAANQAKIGDSLGVTMVNRIWKVMSILAVWLATTEIAFGQDKAQVERGVKVFTDQKCSVCHSIGGKGNTKGALDNVASKLTADEIRAWLVNPAEMTKKTKADRKPPMRAYPNLSKEDVDGLVAYLRTQKKT